jgi:hypothetical protein
MKKSKKIVFSSVFIVLFYAFISKDDKVTNVNQNYKPRAKLDAIDYINKLRNNYQTNELDFNDIINVRQQIKAKENSRSSLGLSWEEIGPDNFAGTVRAILIDKDNRSKLICGGMNGGLFFSFNKGTNWNRIESFNNNLQVASIAQGPNGEIYAGTGSSFTSYSGTGGSGFKGNGVYKSEDGGLTWNHLSSTKPLNNNEWICVNAIAIDQNNGTVYAATNKGLRMSTDGGDTWTNPIYTNSSCTTPNTSEGQDVVVKKDGGVVAVLSGKIFISNDPTVSCSFIEKPTTIDYPGGSRTVIAMSPDDNNYIYSISTSGGNLRSINRSVDGGHTWALLQAPIQGLFDYNFCNGQCYYDLAIGINPNNKEDIIFGGVQLWRWKNNSLTRISYDEDFRNNTTQYSEYYVPENKHIILFDEFDSNILYIGTDRGVSKSIDGGNTFVQINNGLSILQAYSVAFNNNGKVMAGAENYGTIEVTGKDGASGKNGRFIDNFYTGFDCEYSSINETYFFTTFFQYLFRNVENGTPKRICVQSGCDYWGSFYTKLKLWESLNDSLGKTKVSFTNELQIQTIQNGNNLQKTFTGTLLKPQESGSFKIGSIKIYAGIKNTTSYKELTDSAINTTSGEFIGNGTGTIDYTTGDFSVTFNQAPKSNEIIYVEFKITYKIGEKIKLYSNASTSLHEHSFYYTLPYNLYTGDKIEVNDPVQSILVSNDGGGLSITKDALNLSKTPTWIKIPNVVGNYVHALAFSNDGNHLFVGGNNGQVWRVSNLREIFNSQDMINKVSTVKIATFQQVVTSITVDPKNSDIVVVTLGNYGNQNYVYRSISATQDLSVSSGNGSFVSIQGDLPHMPVYTSLIDMNHSSKLIIGTDYGVWATNNIDGSSTTWSDESSEMGRVPIFSLKQQTNPYTISPNKGDIYVGSHGRGLWKSSSLTSVQTLESPIKNKDNIGSLKIYPNPLSSNGIICFELKQASNGTLTIFDLNGKAVKKFENQFFKEGDNMIPIQKENLISGTYILSLNTKEEIKTLKFIVM